MSEFGPVIMLAFAREDSSLIPDESTEPTYQDAMRRMGKAGLHPQIVFLPSSWRSTSDTVLGLLERLPDEVVLEDRLVSHSFDVRVRAREYGGGVSERVDDFYTTHLFPGILNHKVMLVISDAATLDELRLILDGRTDEHHSESSWAGIDPGRALVYSFNQELQPRTPGGRYLR